MTEAEYLQYPSFTAPEIEALNNAGFKKEELKELNGMKETALSVDSNIQKAIIIANMGLSYFLSVPFRPDAKTIKISETQGGVQIKAYNPDNEKLFALIAVITFIGDIDTDSPVSIRYGYILNKDSEYDLIKTIKEYKYNGNDDDIFRQCINFLELTSFSFLTNDGVKQRSELYAGDSINGIIQHPLDGTLAFLDVFTASEVS